MPNEATLPSFNDSKKRINGNAEYSNMAILEMFGGCGGMSEGFKQAGFRITAANEVWQPAAQTYVKNHPNTRMFIGDITSRKVKNEILDYFKGKECDVLIGGPPCQAYSYAGLRKPDDPRGKLFKDYMYMVDKLQPKVFVMENVKGLLSILIEKKFLPTQIKAEIVKLNELKEQKIILLLKRRAHRNGKPIKFTKIDKKNLENSAKRIEKMEKELKPFREKLVNRIMRGFECRGYKVEYRVLNSADYGVPQLRERVIFIGTRLDAPIIFPARTYTKNIELEPNLKPWVTVRDAIDDLKDLEEDIGFNHSMAIHSKEFLEKIKETAIDSSLSDAAHAFHRCNPDKPSWTVKDNHGSVFIHYEKNRVMTPRELARLQSFGDSFIFCCARVHILKQIGNAVPPKLAKAIADSIKQMLDTTKGEKITITAIATQK